MNFLNALLVFLVAGLSLSLYGQGLSISHAGLRMEPSPTRHNELEVRNLVGDYVRTFGKFEGDIYDLERQGDYLFVFTATPEKAKMVHLIDFRQLIVGTHKVIIEMAAKADEPLRFEEGCIFKTRHDKETKTIELEVLFTGGEEPVKTSATLTGIPEGNSIRVLPVWESGGYSEIISEEMVAVLSRKVTRGEKNEVTFTEPGTVNVYRLKDQNAEPIYTTKVGKANEGPFTKEILMVFADEKDSKPLFRVTRALERTVSRTSKIEIRPSSELPFPSTSRP